MFEGKNEREAREQILELVSEYCDRFHNQNKEYKEGDRLPYAARNRTILYNRCDCSRKARRNGDNLIPTPYGTLT